MFEGGDDEFERPASEIQIRALRQIWIWPLTLRLGGRETEASVGEQVQAGAEEIQRTGSTHGWVSVPDLLDHAGPAGPGAPDDVRRDAYAEFVYFHDFVQSILFRKPVLEGDGPASIRLFARTDVDALRIVLADGARRIAHMGNIERLNLYLFGSGAAALVVEACFGGAMLVDGVERPTTLAEAQRLIDAARRCYTPYFDGDRPAMVPIEFSWLKGTAVIGGVSVPESFAATYAHIHEKRKPPLARHWHAILQPLRIEGYTGSEADERPLWRQVVDERVPTMTYLSLTHSSKAIDSSSAGDDADLRRVRRGDWIRLCYADPPGAMPMPYSPGFLAGFEDEACYDRYWPSKQAIGTTRFMFAGYHTSFVGSGKFFDDTLVHHFRRHYFQMGLLLTMEFASLLAVSSRITAAVHRRRSSTSRAGDAKAFERFRADMMEIQGDFLEMMHVYMFTGLSNQIQPTELFQRWRRQLRLDDIFSDLKAEIESANQYLLVRHQDEEKRDKASIENAAHVITVVGAIGLALSLVASIMGLDAGKQTIRHIVPRFAATGDGLSLLGHMFSAGCAIAICSLLMICLLTFLGQKKSSSLEKRRVGSTILRKNDGGMSVLVTTFTMSALGGLLVALVAFIQ